MNNQQWQDALHYIDLQTASKSNLAQLFFLKSIALKYLDQIEQSIQCIKQAQQMMPEIFQFSYETYLNTKNPIELIIQCYYLKEKHQYDAIEQICSEALKQYPKYIPLLYEIALQFYKRKRYELAFSYYEKLLNINDLSYLGLLGKGNVSFRLNDYKAALIWYDQAITFQPLQKACYFKKCKVLEKFEKFQQSILTYELLLIIDQKDEKIYSKRGDALCMMEDFEAAIYSYDKALELSGQNNIAVQLKKANALVKAKKQNQALLIIDQIQKNDPKNFQAYYEKGILLRSLQKYSEAINCFTQAKNYNPDFFKATLELGQTFEIKLQREQSESLNSLFEFQRAVECYDKIIENWPFEIQSYIYKSQLLLKASNINGALNIINESEAIFPNNLQLLNLKTKLLRRANYNKDALEYCDQIIQFYPESSLGYKRKAEMLNHIKKFSEAFKILEKAISLSPITSSLLVTKGNILNNMGQTKEAIKTYDKALKLKPKKINALFNKSKSLEALKKFEEALDIVNNLLVKYPRNPSIFSQKAKILFKQGEYQQAQINCQQALEIDSNCEEALQINTMIESGMDFLNYFIS